MKKLSLGEIYAKDMSSFFGTGQSTNYIAFSIDYFVTSEYFSGWKKKESLLSEQNFDGEANRSGVVSFYCIQMSLVMSMRFIFGVD